MTPQFLPPPAVANASPRATARHHQALVLRTEAAILRRKALALLAAAPALGVEARTLVEEAWATRSFHHGNYGR